MAYTLLAQTTTSTGTSLGGTLQVPGAIGESVNTAVTQGPNAVVGVFETQFSNLIGLITILGGLFFLIYFLVAAFEWIQAGGDSGKIEKSKNRMINGAIGMIVMIVSLAIVGIIGGVFGVDLLNPGQTFLQLIP